MTINQETIHIKNHSQICIFSGDDRKKIDSLGLLYFQSEQRVNYIPSALLHLSLQSGVNTSLYNDEELRKCQVGSQIYIEIYDEEFNKYVEIFSGLITSSNMKLANGLATLTLKLKHQLVRLDSVIRSQVFYDKTDKDIIQELCPRSVADIRNYVNMSIRHEQKIQFRCSDWTMLRNSLDTCGAWLIAEPKFIEIVKPELASEPHHLLNANDNALLQEANWSFCAIDQPANLKLRAWNIDNQSTSSVQAFKPRLGSGALDPSICKKLNDSLWDWGYGSSFTNEELKLEADSKLRDLWLRGAHGRFTLQGSLKYNLGQTLKLSGFGTNFDGTAIITAIIHTITVAQWTTSLIIGEDGIGSQVHHNALSGLQPAVVAVYGDEDPKNYYRIRIHLNALDSDNNKNQLWARFAMPYATKGSSLFFYPEPGDEVVVGFFEDNPSCPVIIGAMHNPERLPAEKPGSGNGIKGWVIEDMRLIINKNEKSLSLQVGESAIVTLKKDDDTLINCKNKIKIEGVNGVLIKGKTIDLTK